ncbi:MAG: hypothetical protein JW783_05940 [Bacteroidales bacterium]|nr:hypothetical protein [Bacteroidales bacterium]MBN2750256.1 hypothetical protein [Bacteroidales bacterium]
MKGLNRLAFGLYLAATSLAFISMISNVLTLSSLHWLKASMLVLILFYVPIVMFPHGKFLLQTMNLGGRIILTILIGAIFLMSLIWGTTSWFGEPNFYLGVLSFLAGLAMLMLLHPIKSVKYQLFSILALFFAVLLTSHILNGTL